MGTWEKCMILATTINNNQVENRIFDMNVLHCTSTSQSIDVNPNPNEKYYDIKSLPSII